MLLVPTLRRVYELQTNSNFEFIFDKTRVSAPVALKFRREPLQGSSFNNGRQIYVEIFLKTRHTGEFQ